MQPSDGNGTKRSHQTSLSKRTTSISEDIPTSENQTTEYGIEQKQDVVSVCSPSVDSVFLHTGGYHPASLTVSKNEYHSISLNLNDANSKSADTEKLISQSYSSVKHQNDEKSRKPLISKSFLKVSFIMAMWIFTSFTSIVLNKYILTGLDVDPGILGECQILMTTFFGALMMYLPIFGLKKTIIASPRYEQISRYQFFKTISILGWLRCGAIICSVIALKYVAVSFSETVKSSAPLFTAIIAYVILGEYSGLYVNLSLLPIMFGLAISTSTEISFNMTGFMAAVINNILDCIQNVFSKKLLSGDEQRFSPLELQFYTSVAASIVQMPFWYFFLDFHEKIYQINNYTAGMLIIDGIVFYSQSLFAYLLMSHISPVTFSVSNTVKRALLIWFSVIMFGNKVTVMSAFGTVLVVCGVFLYQRARHVEAAKRKALFDEQKHDGKSKIINT